MPELAESRPFCHASKVIEYHWDKPSLGWSSCLSTVCLPVPPAKCLCLSVCLSLLREDFTVWLWLARNLLWRLGWPQTQEI